MARLGLVELEAVLAIVHRGSFRAAAVDLGMSTTALSNAIGKLERQIGVRLFNRTTRSLSLTDAGKTFVGQIGPAVENIHDAMNTARSQQETPSGTLRINSFATAAREILAPLVLEFLRRHPGVHIDLVTGGGGSSTSSPRASTSASGRLSWSRLTRSPYRSEPRGGSPWSPPRIS